jgi:hypothetical protein
MTLSLAQSIAQFPGSYQINQKIRDLITSSAVGNMPCTEVAGMDYAALAEMLEATFPDNTAICPYSMSVACSILQTLQELSEAEVDELEL